MLGLNAQKFHDFIFNYINGNYKLSNAEEVEGVAGSGIAEEVSCWEEKVESKPVLCLYILLNTVESKPALCLDILLNTLESKPVLCLDILLNTVESKPVLCLDIRLNIVESKPVLCLYKL